MVPRQKQSPFFPDGLHKRAWSCRSLVRERRGGEKSIMSKEQHPVFISETRSPGIQSVWQFICLLPSFISFCLSLSLCLCASCQHHLSGFSTIRTCFLKQTNEDRLMTVCNIPLCRFSTRLPCRVKHL